MSTIDSKDQLMDQYWRSINLTLNALPNDNRVDYDRLKGSLTAFANQFYNPNTHRFFHAFNELPNLEAELTIEDGCVCLKSSLSHSSSLDLLLRSFIPWRKGPFVVMVITCFGCWRTGLNLF